MQFINLSKIITQVSTLCLLGFATISFASQFKITGVSDGDTLTAEGQGAKITVRLVGIDAPELSRKKHVPGQPFSLKAKDHLAALVLNKTVTIKFYEMDRHGQSLGEVFEGGTNVNLEMLKTGLAEVYRGQPAKDLDIAAYQDAERAAKKKAIGIWELRDQYFSPMDWREVYH